MPGRRKHDTAGSARKHRAMHSGKPRHQRWQLGRRKRARAQKPKGGEPTDVTT